MEILWLIISGLLISLAGASKGVSDIISHHFSASIFSNEKKFKETFWNPSKSWKNKWKDKKVEGKYVEKFPGSSTVFVRFTDAWHGFNSITYWSLFAVIIIQPKLPEWIDSLWINHCINFTIGFSLFTGTFMLFYYKVLVKAS